VRNPISFRRRPQSRSLSGLCFCLVVILSVLTAFMEPAAYAQKNQERKIVYQVEPEYPPDLKHAGIGGYVRLEATISSNGSVESANVTGGNPILAEAAVKAIRKWKYEPLAYQTKAKLVFHFAP
jgi:TonB family protein